MPIEQMSQSLADFNKTAATETLDRLNATGEAEVLTVDGEPRAVLVAPAIWEQMRLSEDVAVMRQSIEDGRQGKGQEAGAFFKELRTELLAMKAAQNAGADK